MSGKLEDILVVCDMDGTLLCDDKRLLPCNLETIRLFRTMGGHFTVATGRTVSSVALYPELACIIDPAITCGGAVIYDFAEDVAVKTSVLPHLAARQGLRDILHKFPQVGIMVTGDDMRLYQVSPSAELEQLIRDENMTYFFRPWEDLPDSWCKMLFAGPPELLEEINQYVSQRTYPGLYFLFTAANYFEMMPKGVSKGSALHELCDIMQMPIRNTYVIGDYYNDLDIMKQAGHAVAVKNAPDDVKLVADEVIPLNGDGGVGQFLYSLIQKYDE